MEYTDVHRSHLILGMYGCKLGTECTDTYLTLGMGCTAVHLTLGTGCTAVHGTLGTGCTAVRLQLKLVYSFTVAE